MFKQLLAKLPRKQSSKNGSNNSDDVAVLPSSINSSNNLNSLAIGVLSSSLNSITRSSSFLNKLSTQNSGSSNSDRLDQERKTLSGNSLSDFGNMPPFDLHAYVPLTSFHDVSNSDKQNLFIKKLKMCCVMFDFTDSSKNVKEKDVKLQTLQELVEYITSSSVKFNESMLRGIVEMVAINLFRILPSTSHEIKHHEAIEGEEEPSMDPSWSHLHIVYEFLLRVVTSLELDTKIAKKYIDQYFVLRLLDLFNSEDQRERDCLKTILHRIYGKFMVHRPFIRKAINNIFYSFIFEGDHHNGIAELLEILGSVINGFALPLKEEHELFLFRALIPLHKPRCLSLYHQQLSYCIAQFVEKDVKLADMVIRGLLKYWPVTNSSKEVMFLCELEEVLEVTRRDEFERCIGPLFQQIACCLNSSHFQVAERALFLWNNGYIQNLISQNQKIILPIIFPALERNTRNHWNRTIQNLTLNVKKSFSDSDPELFDNCLLKFEENEKNEKELMEKRELMWKRLEDAASSKVLGNETLLVSQLVSSLSITTTTPRVIMGN